MRTSQKNTCFKLQNDGSRDSEHAGTLLFKMPLNRLADAIVSIKISLKAIKSACTKNANPRPYTGVRDKDGRAYALKRINIIYMMSNVRSWRYFALKKREKYAF